MAVFAFITCIAFISCIDFAYIALSLCCFTVTFWAYLFTLKAPMPG